MWQSVRICRRARHRVRPWTCGASVARRASAWREMHANNTGALGDFWHDLASRLRLGQRPPRTGVAA
ncbi:protein of unknown function [Microbacterium sp. Nx66]|nr:protein of unknown function [Microbacterium sp. Nx66]